MAFWGKKKEKDDDPDTREDRKKAGLIRRLWHKLKSIDWKNPVNRWKFLFAALIACIIVFGGGYGVLSMTNSPTFCSSCHEMQPEYTTYTASSHSQISCVQCHIKPGFINMITHKMASLKEVYYHVTGVPNQIVQTTEEEISNKNCLQCHSVNRLVTASGDLNVNHQGHIKDGIPCITCHSGVVHAKIAARDLNVAVDRTKWTQQNIDKLVQEKYLNPNMGTCIDCHTKVNKGEKPWLDPAYSVPPNPEEKKTTSAETTAQHEQQTQDVILQAISTEQKEVKVSMACETCHREIKVPSSHKTSAWNTNHGATAIQKLDTCMNCHQDSKWEKQIPKEDIITLLKMGPSGTKYTPNITVAKDEARTNKFCSACHSKRPPGHEQSNQWLTAHAVKASTPAAKAECYVCHDRAKPKQGSTEPKASTDVYCEYCHRTGFKDDTKD